MKTNTIKLITIIIFYYIASTNNIFLFLLSFCLYKIFTALFSHLSLTNIFLDYKELTNKFKILKITTLSIVTISLLFTLLSIFISNIMEIILKINNSLLVFIFMGLSIMTKPLVKITAEYLANIKDNNKYLKFINAFYLYDYITIILISLFTFKVFNINTNLATALIYLPKIVIGIIIVLIIIFMNKKIKSNDRINYRLVLKKIYHNNIEKSIIKIIKYSYYYISVIILYLVLSSRYNYKIEAITSTITFTYFYGLSVINYLIYLIENNNQINKKNVTDIIFECFKTMLPIVIFLSIVSPLICKFLFNNSEFAIYLTMLSFMSIFILLFNITYKNINNKKIIFTSLIIGVIIKLILEIPLINAFYRMGYNLIYGDVLSNIVAMSISITINYIYLNRINQKKDKYFEKILDVIFNNILYCIILILIEFIVPISTDNYIKSIGLLILYSVISIGYIKLKKRRG